MNLARERCNAIAGKGQCRSTTYLTRTQIKIYQNPKSVTKLPEKAVILLCPKHFKNRWPGGAA